MISSERLIDRTIFKALGLALAVLCGVAVGLICHNSESLPLLLIVAVTALFLFYLLNKRPIYGVYLIILTMPFISSWSRPILTLKITELIAIQLIIVLTLSASIGKGRRIKKPPAFVPMICFFLTMVIAYLFSSSPPRMFIPFRGRKACICPASGTSLICPKFCCSFSYFWLFLTWLKQNSR